jgi:chromosome partitioning protein
MMCKVIAIANQKGGVSKTTTTVNLGVGMVRAGKRVLVIDADPQGNLSQSLGIANPDELETALPDIMEQIIMDKDFDATQGIVHHQEGIDLMPCNIDLSGVDVSLVNAMSREYVLKTYVECMKKYYDYILIDCMPSLGMITVNALTASDSVLIPVQAAYLPVKGLEQLVTTIFRVKKHLNPHICFEGILISMLNARTNYAKDIMDLIQDCYGDSIPIFESRIPFSVKASETSAAGVSIFTLNQKHSVAKAYEELTKEVISHE